MADTNGFIYQRAHCPKWKIEFKPRSDVGFERIEAVWNGCQWHVTGREVVRTMRRI